MSTTEECQKEVTKIYGRVANRILLVAEASLQPQQYEAFKKLTLREFGKYGA